MKIRIIGPAGSGKSTLTEHLQKIADVPICQLDQLYLKKHRQQLLQEFLQQHSDWIVEGVFSQRWCHDSFNSADCIVFLDLPLSTCQRQILKRAFHSNTSFTWHIKKAQFTRAKELWHWNRQYCQNKLKLLDQLEQITCPVIFLHSSKEIENFLNHMQANAVNWQRSLSIDL